MYVHIGLLDLVVKNLFLGGHDPATFDRVCSGSRPPYTVQHDIDLLGHLATLGKPGAKVTLCQAVNAQVT